MQLSLAELRKRPGRIETLLTKVKYKMPFDIINGDTKTFDRLAFTDSGRVIEVNPSKDPRQLQMALEWLRKKASSSKYILLVSDKDRIALNDLLKNGDFGGQGGKAAKGAVNGSKADVLESIYAAAIYARFLNQTQLVVEQDIIDVLDQLKDNKPKQLIVKYTKNKNRKVSDVVTLKIAGSLSCMKTLTDKNMQWVLSDIIQASTKFANSSTALSWAKLLFENNRRNNIEITAFGIGDQKGLLPTISVKVDKKKINIRVPLKSDDIKNNGRVVGGSFEEISAVAKSVFGINLINYQSQFFKIREIRGIQASTVFAYKSLAYEFNKAIKNNRVLTYNKMSVALDKTLTKKGSYIITGQFSKSEAQLFKYGNFSKLFTDETKAVILLQKGLPILNIIDKKSKTLIKLQAKQELRINASFLNHYVVKGQLITELGKYIST
jgi:hypothetical protein